MNPSSVSRRWLRRARPLLGTLVEVGIPANDANDNEAIDAAFDAIAEVQSCLSRFEADSDVARFHALRTGQSLRLRPHAAQVFAAAQALHDASAGLFDITLGTAPSGWRCEAAQLWKLDNAVRLDLGGIGKGHAVDVAVEALTQRGCRAGWVNAGGDLRVFGHAELPVTVRDESTGGVRPFATLADGAFATSCLAHAGRRAHASVAAPRCLWADALTKVVAFSGDAAHPLLSRHGAQAWLH